MTGVAGEKGDDMLSTNSGLKIPCICVTNRRLCRGSFSEQLKRVAAGGTADAILLREKDLPEEEYYALAEKVMKICEDAGLPCILHTFHRVAAELGCRRIHLPIGILGEQEPCFDWVGTSVHSVEQAKQVVSLGAGVLVAGHVFETDCKKGLPGRGTSFIHEISLVSELPVYGIGGIDVENAGDVVRAGASGVCIMSGFMLERAGAL